MNTLADIVLQYLCTFLFGHENDIDPDFALREMEALPEWIVSMSPDERTALSAAAQRALTFMLAPPDEYGYTPASLVGAEEKEFLESLASGEFYEQFGA